MAVPQVGQKTPFITRPLFLEGITRAGKFVLANLVAAIHDVEPMQYHGLLEQIPFLTQAGLIDRRTAQQVLQCEVDARAYELVIGRNLNRRRADKSSIYGYPDSARFLQRAEEADTAKLVTAFQKERRYSFFILHEASSFVSMYHDTFPKMKWIQLSRHPVDLVSSWFERGHGRRWGTDPLLLQIPLASRRGSVPWFAADWRKRWQVSYHQLSEMDRVVLSVLTLMQRQEKSMSSFAKEAKSSLLRVRFEQLLLQPDVVVTKLSRFLRKPVRPELAEILRREKLPADPAKARTEKLAKIRRLTSARYYDKLLSAVQAYEGE